MRSKRLKEVIHVIMFYVICLGIIALLNFGAEVYLGDPYTVVSANCIKYEANAVTPEFYVCVVELKDIDGNMELIVDNAKAYQELKDKIGEKIYYKKSYRDGYEHIGYVLADE